MPFERLSGDFNRGYTKAIQDIIKIFNYIQPDLAHHHKKLIPKLSMKLLNVILQERDKLRENWGEDGFIRYNGQKEDFEYFSPTLRRLYEERKKLKEQSEQNNKT